jgi:hypothetical protein
MQLGALPVVQKWALRSATQFPSSYGAVCIASGVPTKRVPESFSRPAPARRTTVRATEVKPALGRAFLAVAAGPVGADVLRLPCKRGLGREDHWLKPADGPASIGWA